MIFSWTVLWRFPSAWSTTVCHRPSMPVKLVQHIERSAALKTSATTASGYCS
ncbi:hypothetical protein PF005_g996 [Phytophthora fragariae]|uniref:Uncharacterized protein n=1 Tax=Phytophthora fragariae TaxID=53985 RepID=A0A6A3FDS0_9STRA|nr:hypothetical protein PF003_g1445 [Phytophthora fragariae]KAE8943283.1 hypothetical protein PF009_g6987 [Phytophthora fragariae]KAE9020091.1 hypothetical protein PF011_g5569 [Phytophthora fragariae]KAE9124574.1 hypothetical protein PF010_g5961 [Phytophthora fragariae]KAE9134177.1 hypothetical protein PF007_g3050 [Phytophthora fragariae]